MNIVSFVNDQGESVWGILIERRADDYTSGIVEVNGERLIVADIAMPYPAPSDVLPEGMSIDSLDDWTRRMDKILVERRHFLEHFGNCLWEVDHGHRVRIYQMYMDLLDNGATIDDHGFFLNTFHDVMDKIVYEWTRLKGYSSNYRRIKVYNELEGFNPSLIGKIARKVARHYKSSDVNLISVNQVDLYSSERKWFNKDMSIQCEYTHSLSFSYKDSSIEEGRDTWITTWGITKDGKFHCWAD